MKKGRHLADELVPKVPIVLREIIFSIFLSNVKIKISVITEWAVMYLPSPSLHAHRAFLLVARAKLQINLNNRKARNTNMVSDTQLEEFLILLY